MSSTKGFTLCSCVYHDSHCYVQPWARAAHPSCSALVSDIAIFVLKREVKKWQWWMWMVAAIYVGGLTAQVGRLGLRVGGRLGAQSAFIK